MNATYDDEALMKLLMKIVREGTGHELYDAVNTGPRATYPFFTYDFIEPYIPLPFTDNLEFEPFEMSLMLEAHSEDNFEAIRLARQLNKLLQTQNASLQFERNNIYVIDTSAIEQTDNPISVQVERRAGFTLNLRVIDQFTDDAITIDDININGSNLPKAD